ncbi:gallate 1-beta-glucosyltransferase 84A24-like [Solanum dulcamara]|uniref:gallate 1-beta-glucosyltransferase 84A24-like n=1 Tax=Solanum dulcamara TaxID=45834 RepID=UPI0024854D96|nr:gallate 1-beta-glucosyltransferase 84A24-like [Solanum dulcamara]
MGSQGTINSFIHVFLISFPGQGHVNPLLRLGKRLALKGVLVTFCAPECVGKDMRASNNNIISNEPIRYGNGLIRFEFFDGWEYTQPKENHQIETELANLEVVGRAVLPALLKQNELQGRPVSCLINNPFIPWVCDVAKSLDIPYGILWIQSCASFSSYYHYYFNLATFPNESNPNIDVRLPNMPILKWDELPSFLLPSNPYPVLANVILHQFNYLSNPIRIFIESFDELEQDIVDYMSNFLPIKTIGPLLVDEDSKIGENIRGDLVKADSSITQWLNSKPSSSVVYISFGSIVVPSQEQIDEIAYGLLNSGLNFLWIMKPPRKNSSFPIVVLPQGYLEKVGNKGKIVEWCLQEEVLAHPSLACFLTHCGWNSSMEAIANGVPIVAFPQWGDQVTDAKYLVDEFKIGVRLCRGVTENRIIPRYEVEQSLHEVTNGPKAAEMKSNALNWKKKAAEAVAEGGSSDQNLQSFIDELMTLQRSNQKLVKLVPLSN